jgi:predicted secreted protein
VSTREIFPSEDKSRSSIFQEDLPSIKMNSLKSGVATYNLGQPFTIDLDENPTTGYQWQAETTPGLVIVSSTYSNRCPPGIQGCGGIHTWVLKGTQRGLQQFIAHYSRSWEPDPIKTEIVTVEIV